MQSFVLIVLVALVTMMVAGGVESQLSQGTGQSKYQSGQVQPSSAVKPEARPKPKPSPINPFDTFSRVLPESPENLREKFTKFITCCISCIPVSFITPSKTATVPGARPVSSPVENQQGLSNQQISGTSLRGGELSGSEVNPPNTTTTTSTTSTVAPIQDPMGDIAA